jgi:hypothetical protein
MQFLYSNLRNLPSMFSSAKLLDIEVLRQSLLEHNWRLYQVDDVGLMGVGPTLYRGMPDVHITFWDKRLRGREGLCRAVAYMVMGELEVPGLYTPIPATARATLAFAKRVGFRVVDYQRGKARDSDGQVDDAVVLVLP